MRTLDFPKAQKIHRSSQLKQKETFQEANEILARTSQKDRETAKKNASGWAVSRGNPCKDRICRDFKKMRQAPQVAGIIKHHPVAFDNFVQWNSSNNLSEINLNYKVK